MNGEKRIIKTTIVSAFLTALFWSIAIYVYLAYFTELGIDNSVGLGLALMYSITVGFFVGGIIGLIVGLTNQSVIKSLITGAVFCFVFSLLFSIWDTMKFDGSLNEVPGKLKFMLIPTVLVTVVSAISAGIFNKPDEN
jgi:hypothetical protein